MSYLRSLFKHWVRKDRLLRVDAINAERNRTGIPLAYATKFHQGPDDGACEIGAVVSGW
jgi:hypothetical protein